MKPDSDDYYSKVERAKGAKEVLVATITDFAFSNDSTLKGYAEVASGIYKRLGSLEGGRGFITEDDSVDMTGLKELARTKLPPRSQLRKLIEAEEDRVSYEAWLGKMPIYGRLLTEETKFFPSSSLSEP